MINESLPSERDIQLLVDAMSECTDKPKLISGITSTKEAIDSARTKEWQAVFQRLLDAQVNRLASL